MLCAKSRVAAGRNVSGRLLFCAPHEGRCRHDRVVFASLFAQGCATHERQFPIQLRRRPLSGAVLSGVFDKTRSSQVLCTFIAPSGQNS